MGFLHKLSAARARPSSRSALGRRTRPWRAVTSCSSSWRFFVLRLAVRSSNTSPEQAIICASIGSFLANGRDLAKWRTRLGSTITTSKPPGQQPGPPLLVAAGGFHHRLANTMAGQHSTRSSRPSALSANVAAAAAERIATLILVLETSMPDKQTFLCHPPAPFLARYGLHAHATVRVKEDIGLSLAPSQALPFGVTGSGRRRAAASTAARSRILPNFPDHKGVMLRINETP